MNCPICKSSQVKVYNSRRKESADDDLGTVERYRECFECSTRWKTVERFENLVAVEGRSTRPERTRDGTLHGVTAVHKLSGEQVSEIRRRAKTETCAVIAPDFGVTAGHVARIVNGTRWSTSH